jgi:hypothetical protein
MRAMLPDLRFAIGAVLATALLGVTAFGMAAAVQIAHQGKVSPLEASRMLAYTPDARRELQADSGPFANIPADRTPLPPPAPVVRNAANDTPAAASETPAAPPSGDPDMVDERAVVDPPLPLDSDPQPTAAEAPPAQATPMPTPAAAPIETAPAAPAPAGGRAAAQPDIEPVGSIPRDAAAEPAPLPKRKAAAKKAAPKQTTAPKQKAAPRLAARPRLRAGSLQPSASTGYPVSPFDDMPRATQRAAARPAQQSKGLWPESN